VVVNSFFARFRTIAGTLAAAATLIGASPAFANSSASADIAAPLRAAQAARQQPLGNRDEQFKQLFSNWQSLDKTGVPSLAAVADAADIAASSGSAAGRNQLVSLPVRRAFSTPSVSIPSRMPVEGVRLTSDYGLRFHPVLGGRRQHKGVDLAGPVGTPVHATADGTVSKAEWFSSYGLYISLEHGGDLQTRYGHMSRLNVAAGQHVRKGDIIGFIGSTGRSTGPHLHYEVRVAGQAVNPVPYMQADEFRQTALALNTPATVRPAAR
jgi:murein DD-endopeptidase MepM/ murein hydrolase activator NlpD